MDTRTSDLPICLHAAFMLEQVDATIQQIHQKLIFAHSSDEDFKAKEVYDELWSLFNTYLFCLERIETSKSIADLDPSFHRLKTSLTKLEGFERLATKKKHVLIAALDLFQALAKLKFLFIKLKNNNKLVEFRDVLQATQDQLTTLNKHNAEIENVKKAFYQLEIKIQAEKNYIAINSDSIVRYQELLNSHMQDLHKTWMEVNLIPDNFKQMQEAVQNFNHGVNEFQLSYTSATRFSTTSNMHYEMTLSFNNIQKRTQSLLLSEDPQDVFVIDAELKTIQQFKNKYEEIKQILLAKHENLALEYAELSIELKNFPHLLTQVNNHLKNHLQLIKNTVTHQVLPAPSFSNEELDMLIFQPHLASYDLLQRHLNQLMQVMENIKATEKKFSLLHQEIIVSEDMGLPSGIENTIQALVTFINQSEKNLRAQCEQQYSIFNIFNASNQNDAWLETEKSIGPQIQLLNNEVWKSSLFLKNRLPAQESKALRICYTKNINTIVALREELGRKIEIYQHALEAFALDKELIQNEITREKLSMFSKAQMEVEELKRRALDHFNLTKLNVNKFNVKLTPLPKINPHFIDEKSLIGWEKKLQEKRKLLFQLLPNRPKTVKEEVDEIIQQTLQRNPAIPLTKREGESSFWQHYRRKLLIGVLISGLFGLGGGLTVGLLGLPLTFGLSLPFCILIGWATGTLVGGSGGLILCKVFQCLKAKPDNRVELAITPTPSLSSPKPSIGTTAKLMGLEALSVSAPCIVLPRPVSDPIETRSERATSAPTPMLTATEHTRTTSLSY